MRSESRQKSKMELLTKTVYGIHLFTIFAKCSQLGVLQGYYYTSDNTK